MTPREVWRRFLFWMNREQLTRDLEEEMRIHVDMRADALRATGSTQNTVISGNRVSAAHSKRIDVAPIDLRTDPHYSAAKRRFGNITTLQQRSRDMWGFGAVEEFAQDVKFACRRLAQRRAFAAAVIGVMAVGIGATTAMFSAVDAALLRPLPFAQAEQLVSLRVDVPFQEPPDEAYSHPMERRFEISDATAMHETFASVAGYAAGALDLADADNPLHLNTGVVSWNFFNTLGIRPIAGRTFAESEGRIGGPKVAILSHGLWKREYGSRNIAGLKIVLGQDTYEVVGVMPESFGFPRQSDIWIPMSIPNTIETARPFKGGISVSIVGRMQSGVTAQTASARMLTRWKQIYAAQPRSTDAKAARADRTEQDLIENGGAVALQQHLVGDKKRALLVLLGATGLLLLVACVNVTNLLLSHAAVRAREISIRQVLGATRTRIIRQLIAESIVLSLAGAMLGTLLAPLALQFIGALMPRNLTGLAPAHVDFRILAFATLLAVITGIAFGLWPALGSSRNDSSDVIKSGGGHGSTSARGGKVRRVLVGAELALTTALLIGAGLMLQSFRELMNKETGMLPQQVGTLQFTFRRTADAEKHRSRVMEDVLNRFATMPDIAAAGFVNDLPLGSGGMMALRLKVEGAPRIAPSDDPSGTMTRWLQASSGYFPTMGVKLVRGRFIRPDDNAGAPRVAVINERMAKVYWAGRDAIGGRFRFPMDSTPVTVVGIVADVREESLEDEPMMQAYLSAHAQAPGAIALVARSALPAEQLLQRMRAVVRAVDNTQAVYNVRMMQDVVDISVAPRRTNTILISTFAMLALLLASVGVYAVVSYGVSHRSRELGIRSALGATASSLMQMISREMLSVIVLGVAAGIAGAWALARTLERLVYGVKVHDPATFVVVPLALVIAAAVAAVVPARRVLQVDPAQVMRAD